jgi:hypothetical protein
MELWKPLGAPLIVAAVVGAVAFFWGRATAPDAPSVQAEFKSVDIANPVLASRSGIGANLEKAIQPFFNVSGSGAVIDQMSYRSEWRIGVLTFNNNGAVRTKAIEVSVNDPAILFSSGSTGDRPAPTTRQLHLKPLDPGTSTTVYFVSPAWSAYAPTPVRALHDGRKIEIASHDLPAELSGFVRLVDSYPFIIGLLLLAAMISLPLLIMILIGSAIFHYNMDLRARATSKDEIKRTAEFLEYVRAKYPDKIS